MFTQPASASSAQAEEDGLCQPPWQLGGGHVTNPGEQAVSRRNGSYTPHPPLKHSKSRGEVPGGC